MQEAVGRVLLLTTLAMAALAAALCIVQACSVRVAGCW